MNAVAPLQEALDGLDTAVAVLAAADLRVLWENRRFTAQFPAVERALLEARLPGFDRPAAQAALGVGETYRQPLELVAGGRFLAVEASIKAAGPPGQLLLEVRDLTAQREAECLLESYTSMAERHARELAREKERAEKLLLTLMPRAVYEELKEYGTATPQRFDRASVLLLDFVGFTEMALRRDPAELVAELNDIFSTFDRIVELFGCERIKTIGDAYMAVSGLPEPASDHAAAAVRTALRMRRYLERRNGTHPRAWHCRIGIATGPVIGSLVGVQKYVYDLFGPTVNLAARLEQQCRPMEIALCEATLAALGDGFEVEAAGEAQVKGLGRIALHRLLGERGERR